MDKIQQMMPRLFDQDSHWARRLTCISMGLSLLQLRNLKKGGGGQYRSKMAISMSLVDRWYEGAYLNDIGGVSASTGEAATTWFSFPDQKINLHVVQFRD
jgi:hypothetical protein